MKTWPLKLVSVLVVLVSGIGIACSGDDDESVTESSVYDTQVDASVLAGHLGPVYEEPIPVTDGDYWSEENDYAALSARAAEVLAQSGLPIDDVVAGIRLVPVEQGNDLDKVDPDGLASSCKGAKFTLVTVLEFGYLPPGTSLRSPHTRPGVTMGAWHSSRSNSLRS